MGKYQKIREIIREVMNDGKAHTAEELHRICESKGIEISRNRAEIYNCVHQLKRKNEVISDGENGYKKSMSVQEFKQERRFVGEVDLSEFELINPAIRKRPKQVISVFSNGDLAINGALNKVLRTNKVEIHIKKDCSQILLIPDGKVLLDISKNNRIKNYRIYEKLEKRKVKFPVYYVGEWNEEDKVWMGDLVMANPNKTAGKVTK